MDDMKDMLEGPCGATVPTKTNCETAYELSIEDIENAPDQDIGDAILFHMTKTADGAIEICPSKDGQITLRNAEQVSWFINQLLGLSRS